MQIHLNHTPQSVPDDNATLGTLNFSTNSLTLIHTRKYNDIITLVLIENLHLQMTRIYACHQDSLQGRKLSLNFFTIIISFSRHKVSLNE